MQAMWLLQGHRTLPLRADADYETKKECLGVLVPLVNNDQFCWSAT